MRLNKMLLQEKEGVGEMAQWIRSYTALAEGPSSVSSTHTGQLINYLYLQFQEIQPLLVALTCAAHIHAEKLTHMKDPPKPESNNKNCKRKK